MKLYIQLLYTLPSTLIKGWHEFNRSPRAKAFAKLSIETLGDVMLHIMIAGTVFVIEVMNIFEGNDLVSKIMQIDLVHVCTN